MYLTGLYSGLRHINCPCLVETCSVVFVTNQQAEPPWQKENINPASNDPSPTAGLKLKVLCRHFVETEYVIVLFPGDVTLSGVLLRMLTCTNTLKLQMSSEAIKRFQRLKV